MEALLQELENEMAKVHPNLRDLLNPGLTKTEIESQVSQLPFPISKDIISLYEWSNGTDCKLYILPGQYLLPLEEAIREFQEIWPMKDELQEIFFQKYFDCFRFLSDLSDGGVSFGRIDSLCKGKMVELCIHHEWELAFDSLSNLLRTAIECYKRGVYTGNKNPDFNLYFKIGKELNPTFVFWDA